MLPSISVRLFLKKSSFLFSLFFFWEQFGRIVPNSKIGLNPFKIMGLIG
jgi:hypothetical protein